MSLEQEEINTRTSTVNDRVDAARKMLGIFFHPADEPAIPIDRLSVYSNNAGISETYLKSRPVSPRPTSPIDVGGAALQHPYFKDANAYNETNSVEQPEIQGAGDRLSDVMGTTAQVVLNAREAAVGSPAATDKQFATAA
jgi:hypothetical protein